MLYREIIVCSEIHARHMNPPSGRNVEFLGAFEKLRKATISFAMSVCPSVRSSVYPHERSRHPLNGFSLNLVFRGFIFENTHRYVKIHFLKKDKAVPLEAWSGPEGTRKLRFPDNMSTAQDGGKVVSLTHRPPLPPGNTPGTHFC